MKVHRRPGVWVALVPVVAIFAGLLAVTTAHTANGTDLRSQQTDVAGLVRTAEGKIVATQSKTAKLQRDIADRTDLVASSDRIVAQITSRSQPLLDPAGLTGVTGPGLEVTLDDAHPPQVDPNANPNDLVVHQWDMQAVVNALWAGGAEAMTLMGQRLIATSAVRCVGNTLLLNGRLFSPPFKVSAIGPADTMRGALEESHNVTLYREAVKLYGLGYNVVDKDAIIMSAYDAPIDMTYATAGK